MWAATDMQPVLAAHLPLWQRELHSLAAWWRQVAQDPRGGFYGEVGLNNQPVAQAPRGLIHNARILYFFSRLAQHTGDAAYEQSATHAYSYLADHFADPVQGGYFWQLDARGHCLDGRKHLYAQAFALYGLSAYYQLTQRQEVLAQALHLFNRLETVAQDHQYGGYLECFSETWQPLADTRLCEAAPMAAKTLNTHLHLLEAYSALAAASGDSAVRSSLARLVGVFCEHIVDGLGGHLRMFMARDWRDCSESISFGHDIEASWLLAQALDQAGEPSLLARYGQLPQQLAEASLMQAWSPRGGIRDEQHLGSGAFSEARTWWAQAEAFIGYLHAWRRSGDDRYAQRALAIWQFIEAEHKDTQLGEWFWFAKQDTQDPPNAYQAARSYKSGFWKCPYHNGRALIEACALLT